MLTFAILACGCAVYFAGGLEISMRAAEEGSKTPLAQVIQTLAGLLPVIASGAIQYWRLRQGGAAGSRLWLGVAGTAVGAPIVGLVLMLIVSFALFSKSP